MARLRVGAGGSIGFGLNGRERPRRGGKAEGIITHSVRRRVAPLSLALIKVSPHSLFFLSASQIELRDALENGKWKKHTHTPNASNIADASRARSELFEGDAAGSPTCGRKGHVDC